MVRFVNQAPKSPLWSSQHQRHIEWDQEKLKTDFLKIILPTRLGKPWRVQTAMPRQEIGPNSEWEELNLSIDHQRQPELKTLEWWIQRSMLDLLILLNPR